MDRYSGELLVVLKPKRRWEQVSAGPASTEATVPGVTGPRPSVSSWPPTLGPI